MICERSKRPGDTAQRKLFTKSSGCTASLNITFWGLVNNETNTLETVLTELTFPNKSLHNHTLDEFSISASNTFPKLKRFIRDCVDMGVGHVNTYIRTIEYAREKLVPQIEEETGMKISANDTRFFPTKRIVYIYWMKVSGGSVKSVEDQNKVKEFLAKVKEDKVCGDDFYYNYEPFDPKLLASSYGVDLDASFEKLLDTDFLASLDFSALGMDNDGKPFLPDTYFEGVAEHLLPSKESSFHVRYDQTIKLLIRKCKNKHTAHSKLKPGQRTGMFYLFVQMKIMADFFINFGHKSIIFMDSGYRVNRNAFPITFISVLDNFMRGRLVGVLISQFADEFTYRKCLAVFKRGELVNIEPRASMCDFDTAELSAFHNTWPGIAMLLCTYHAVTSQKKWIDRNVRKELREKVKSRMNALHYVDSEVVFKKKKASFKAYLARKGLSHVKEYFRKVWEPFAPLWVQCYRNDFWSGQCNTNNISEARVNSYKKGLKVVTDSSIFSAVKFLLGSYTQNDELEFFKLNRDHS